MNLIGTADVWFTFDALVLQPVHKTVYVVLQQFCAVLYHFILHNLKYSEMFILCLSVGL